MRRLVRSRIERIDDLSRTPVGMKGPLLSGAHGKRGIHVQERKLCRSSMLLVRAFASALLLTTVTVTAGETQGRAPEPGYLDDRSTPEAVVSSYYDAVSRREYARAYSYWEPEAAARELAPFDEFASGYTDTASVALALGVGDTGVGAGQLYFTVPVTLVATMTDGSVQTFVGCYTLHLGRPQLQVVPPFRPLGIQRASMVAVDNDADTAGLMAQACGPV